jgi:Carboxypeptidase regulatory-like domain
MRHASRLHAIAVFFFMGGLGPAAALAQTTPVLAVVPEGAVVDAAAFPDLAAGATFTFRSSQGDGKELARGSVLDVRDGRALVGLSPGGAVKEGDVAVRCATAASQTQLRASLDQIKAQMSGGTATPQVQQVLADLDATVQARDTAISSGTCDVSALDQKLAELGATLQQAMAPSQPTASPAAGSPATPSGGATDTTVTDSGAAGTPAAPSAGSGDSMEQVFSVVSRLFKMFQGLGLGSGDGKSGASSGQDSSVIAGSDSTTTPTPQPPPFSDPGVGTAPTPPPSSSPSPGVVGPPSTSQPPIGGGSPGSSPPPTGPITTGPVSPPPAAAPPKVVVPPQPPWWTVTKPKPGTPAPGGNAGTGTAPGGSAGTGSVPSNPLQGIGARPGIPVPGGLRPVGPIAAVRPGAIHGKVLGDVDGRPGLDAVRGASVLISDGPAGAPDRRVTTNDTGAFTFAGLAAGRYSIVVTAAGFRSATLAVSVTPGDDVPMNVTLQRQMPAAPMRPRPVPGPLQPAHPRTQSP